MRKTTIVTSSFLILVAATIVCIQPSLFAQSGDSLRERKDVEFLGDAKKKSHFGSTGP